MKKLVFFLFTFAMFNGALAATLNLGSGESATIQANVATTVTCGGGAPSPGSGPAGELAQCYQDNSNLKVQVNQLQNDLYQCQNQRPKVWNCTYTCGGNNGMGSDPSEAVACKAAKQDSGVQCSAQCVCNQN